MVLGRDIPQHNYVDAAHSVRAWTKLVSPVVPHVARFTLTWVRVVDSKPLHERQDEIVQVVNDQPKAASEGLW